MELKLVDDQINSDEWIKLCDYAFSDMNFLEPYVDSQCQKSNGRTKIFRNQKQIGDKGTIFCGTAQSIMRCFAAIPTTGKYILVTRDIDVRVTHELFNSRPKSIKHWFAINCQIKHPELTAIPYGCNSILGYSHGLKLVNETVERSEPNNRIFCRINTPRELPQNHQRYVCINALSNNLNATVLLNQIDAIEMYIQMKQHTFIAAPIGVGDDCLRMCESIILGAIPILTDCPTTRQFESLPVAYTTDWNITEEWCEQQKELVKNKSTEIIRMSYWKKILNETIQKYGITPDK